MVIKKDIRRYFIKISDPHPSLRCIERDIDQNIVYKAEMKEYKAANGMTAFKKVAKDIGLRIFCKDIREICRRWNDKNSVLLNQYNEGKKVNYSTVRKLKPSWCRYQPYMKVMACDNCHTFKWIKEAVDNELSEFCSCANSNNSNCVICRLLNVEPFDLVKLFCCCVQEDSYLDETFPSIPALKCAHRQCAECNQNDYALLFDDDEVKIEDSKTIRYKALLKNDGSIANKSGSKQKNTKDPKLVSTNWGA